MSDMKITRWWLVRHAPVVGVNGRIYGSDDVACDTSDTASFQSLAGALPEGAHWITSHLSRTKLTAQAIASGGLRYGTAHEEPHFGEQSFGDWQGKTWDDMRAADPGFYEEFWRDPTGNRPPNGESFADLVSRVGAALDHYTNAHNGHDIVLVSHGGTVRAALTHALGINPAQGMSFTVDTLSLTRIEYVPGGLLNGKGGAWRIVYVNKPAVER